MFLIAATACVVGVFSTLDGVAIVRVYKLNRQLWVGRSSLHETLL